MNEIRNRSAYHEYFIEEKYDAGIVLAGTEVKSIREGKVNLQDGFCYFNNGELFVKSITINAYAQGTHYNHEPKRDRKLLLNKSEIRKLVGKMKDQGLTIVPLKLFISEEGWAKLEIALAKGKKLFDKRQDIKKKDIQRETQRRLK